MSQQSVQDWRAVIQDGKFESVAAYDKARGALQAAEKSRAFDAEAYATSSDIENEANELVRKIKLYDQNNTYASHFHAKEHATGRSVGQHFLGSVDLINGCWLMNVAKRMPKASHLHIHFNSCLPADFLIQQARDIDAMYIRSTLPLTTLENITHSRISFMVLTAHEAEHIKDGNGTEKRVPLGNIFDKNYVSNTWMKYKQFQNEFKLVDEQRQVLSKTAGAEIWLARKLQISEQEAHGVHQTCKG